MVYSKLKDGQNHFKYLEGGKRVNVEILHDSKVVKGYILYRVSFIKNHNVDEKKW
jgi:hypothetical protein